ncbi:MAG: DoxX family protein [Ferruginibacter sp.]
MEITKPVSKKAIWAGRIISGLCILFLLADAIMKVAKTAPSVEGSIQLGWPEQSIQSIGILLLCCTVLYIIPRTAIAGAVLLTGFLGGATAIMIRADIPGHPYFFPVVLGILIWFGLFLRDEKLRTLIAGPEAKTRH